MRLLEAQDRISSGGHAFQGQQAGRGETRQVPTDNAQIPSSLGSAGGGGGRAEYGHRGNGQGR